MDHSLNIVVKTLRWKAQNFSVLLENELKKEQASLRGDGKLTLHVVSPYHVSGKREYSLKDDDGGMREYIAHFSFYTTTPDVTTFYRVSLGPRSDGSTALHAIDAEKLDPTCPDRNNVIVIQRLIKNAQRAFENKQG